MSERKLLYEGKAKKVFEAEEPETLVVSYKDDATAFNGLKKGTITGKGEINNRMSNLLMQMLEKSGIPTHFIKELSPRETLVKIERGIQHITGTQLRGIRDCLETSYDELLK